MDDDGGSGRDSDDPCSSPHGSVDAPVVFL
jgi:hypothetical protein